MSDDFEVLWQKWHGKNLFRLQFTRTVIKRSEKSTYVEPAKFLISIGSGKDAVAFQLSMEEATLVSTLIQARIGFEQERLRAAYQKVKQEQVEKPKQEKVEIEEVKVSGSYVE